MLIIIYNIYIIYYYNIILIIICNLFSSKRRSKTTLLLFVICYLLFSEHRKVFDKRRVKDGQNEDQLNPVQVEYLQVPLILNGDRGQILSPLVIAQKFGSFRKSSYLCSRNPARVRYTEAQASVRGLYFNLEVVTGDRSCHFLNKALIPQHFSLTIFISFWATKYCP